MNKKKELFFFIVWPIVCLALALSLKFNVMISLFVFFVVPSSYLLFLLRGMLGKVSVFAFFSALAMVVISYVVNITQQWIVPVSGVPFRIFGIVPLEDPVGIFFSVCFILLFYEYFLEPHRKQRVWYPRMKFFAALFIGLFILFLFCYFFFPEVLLIPRFFLWMGLVFVLLPAIIELVRRPALLPKFLVTGSYFFYFLLLYEITGLRLGWWIYPANWYVGKVVLLGVEFPFEEFIFWIVLFSIAVLSYYEPFDDDEK